MITINEEAVARERAAYWFGYHAAYAELQTWTFQGEPGAEHITRQQLINASEQGQRVARSKVGG